MIRAQAADKSLGGQRTWQRKPTAGRSKNAVARLEAPGWLISAPARRLAPTSVATKGTGGGRICWAVAGTLCGGKIQGTFAQKAVNCMACEFYRAVRREEGAAF